MNVVLSIFLTSIIIFALYWTGLMAGACEFSLEVTVMIGVCIAAFFGAVFGFALHQDISPKGYYLPCEIIATNDYCTYFGTVDSDSQEIYAVETGDHIWPDNVPYLLHMDSKGTKDIKDDEVLVVWRTD